MRTSMVDAVPRAVQLASLPLGGVGLACGPCDEMRVSAGKEEKELVAFLPQSNRRQQQRIEMSGKLVRRRRQRAVSHLYAIHSDFLGYHTLSSHASVFPPHTITR